jgi:DNA mismatch endonuclease (patch repair protein)
MDHLTPVERSQQMRLVRSENTKPEMAVRRMVHRMGFRYRLHVKDLPGHPDLVFPGRRKIIFIHGCFWHGHRCRAGMNRPASNVNYWTRKLERTRKRDRGNIRMLGRLGWDVLVLWECQLRRESLPRRVAAFLNAKP